MQQDLALRVPGAVKTVAGNVFFVLRTLSSDYNPKICVHSPFTNLYQAPKISKPGASRAPKFRVKQRDH